MSPIDPRVWHRHPALAIVARCFPSCAKTTPPTRAQLQTLSDRSGHGWRLVEAIEVTGSYETAVADGRIPVRDGSWHDVFNVLSFARFPRAKMALHARVLALQEQRQGAGTRVRSREEDALTLLDEAVIVIGGRERGVRRLNEARAANELDAIEACMRDEGLVVTVFGHALLEHLVYERPPIGAGVLPLVVAEAALLGLASVDVQLADAIREGRFERPMFGPSLPWPDERVQTWCS
jgi:hypothetical protein